MILGLLLAGCSRAAFILSQNLNEAQKHIGMMRLDKGKALLDVERRSNPQNYAVDFIENYLDFYRILCAQNPEAFRQAESKKDIRLGRLQKIEKNNPYHLYAQAEIHMQWAFLSSMFEEYVSAAWNFRSAYKLMAENQKKFPAFLPNTKEMGVLKAMLGVVPQNYKWILSIAGMEGNFEEGMSMLKTFVESHQAEKEMLLEQQNGKYMYCLFHLNFVKDKAATWKQTNLLLDDYKTNLLSNCVRAYVAMQTDNNDEGIRILQNKPAGSDYERLVYTDYLMGKARLNKLETEAQVYFLRFVSASKDKHIVKEGYVRLAWCAWLRGDSSNYLFYMNLAKKYSKQVSKMPIAPSQGNATQFPDRTLLKARLLFDGGYYDKAESLLLGSGGFKNKAGRTEYAYRLGRIYHETNKLSKAMDSYYQSIKESENTGLYFAPNSWLQLGYIYEKLNFVQTAKSCYKKVFEYDDYEFQNGIEQKAKAALSRIK